MGHSDLALDQAGVPAECSLLAAEDKPVAGKVGADRVAVGKERPDRAHRRAAERQWPQGHQVASPHKGVVAVAVERSMIPLPGKRPPLGAAFLPSAGQQPVYIRNRCRPRDKRRPGDVGRQR